MALDEFSISMPVVCLPAWEKSPLLVVPTSPLRMRLRVEKIARYFKREMRTDCVPLRAQEEYLAGAESSYEAHLFFQQARDHLQEDKPFPSRLVGAACFRRLSNANPTYRWEFSWVWLHPFARQRGHLSSAWPYFQQRYGAFNVSQVLSRDMQAFLAKRSTEA
jgi:hypothetical protein